MFVGGQGSLAPKYQLGLEAARIGADAGQKLISAAGDAATSHISQHVGEGYREPLNEMIRYGQDRLQRRVQSFGSRMSDPGNVQSFHNKVNHPNMGAQQYGSRMQQPQKKQSKWKAFWGNVGSGLKKVGSTLWKGVKTIAPTVGKTALSLASKFLTGGML